MRLIKQLLFLLLLTLALYGVYQLFNYVLTPPKSLSVTVVDDASKTDQTPLKPLTDQQAQKQALVALNYINQIRAGLNLTPLTSHPQLNRAAENHARYCVNNDIQKHLETPDKKDFTGKTPNDRAFAVGYPTVVNEVISFNRNDAKPFVDDLMSAIYHRLGLLSMTIDQAGVGIFASQQGVVKSAFTAETSNRQLEQLCRANLHPRAGEFFYRGMCRDKQAIPQKDFQQAQMRIAKQNPKLLVWPQDGATVPPVFYEEHPDPLPNCDVSGYPVHIQINPIYLGRITFIQNSFQLFDVTNGTHQPVKLETRMTNLTDPNHEIKTRKEQWYALFPKLRLNWNSEYLAQVQYRENGKTQTKRWHFHTPTQRHLVVFRSATGNRASLPIKVGDTRIFYFKPDKCQAPRETSVETLSPSTVKIHRDFIDGQTVKIHLLQGRRGDIIQLKYQPTQTTVTLKVH